MEEVWKDINLSTLNDPHGASNADYRSVIFQDFLARSPYDSPSSQDISSSSLSPASPLVTALSLGSVGPRFPFVDTLPKPTNSHPASLPSLTPNHPFSSFPCASASPSFRYKRQFPESDIHDPNNPPIYNVNNHSDSSGSERHKRMIKNRESAARSRARKQEKTAF
ncbi:protein FD-like [Neltuma alba]|uniref:protein FD-like n=1 Tax=Neltuma alba TaxID=207710 RepID=UPI0010A4E88B|nr:protein FD-like [Prosopis alba]